MKAKAILFDLDGTLVDSVPDLANAVDATLRAMGYAPAGVQRVRMWIGNGASVLVQRALAYAKASAIEALSADETDAALAHFMTHYRQACCDQSSLYDDVVSTLQYCLDSGYKMAIVTNKPYEFAVQMSEHYGLNTFCPVLLGGDSVDVKKPDPSMLVQAAQQLQVGLADCVMVGDSKSDVLVAKAANIDCYAVTYGYHRDEDLLALGAKQVVDSFSQLQQLL